MELDDADQNGCPAPLGERPQCSKRARGLLSQPLGKQLDNNNAVDELARQANALKDLINNMQSND